MGTREAAHGNPTRDNMRILLSGPIRLVVGVAVSAGLGWLAIRGLQWDLVADQLAGVSVPLVILSVAVFMFASYLRALRWRILFVNVDISSRRLFIIQNEGIGINNMVPLRVASEPTQLAVLTIRDGINGATALATLGMQRVIDVVASALILVIAFFLAPERESFKIYVWVALVFTVVVVGLVRLFAWSSEEVGFVRRIPFVAAFATAVRELERERLRLLASFALSVCYWILVGITAWIVAVAIDLSISPVTATLVIMVTISFASFVPAAPSAIGTFELAAVYLLRFFGIGDEVGIGFAVIAHAVLFLPPTIIAAMFLPREGIQAVRRRPKGTASSGKGGDTGR